MPKINPHHALDEDNNFVPDRRKIRKVNKRHVKVKDHAELVVMTTSERSEHAVLDEFLQHHDAEVGADAVFTPTLSAKRLEREWILNYLGAFYDEEIITDVLRRVKGGKEANVYCCSPAPESDIPLIAAKLYRPRMLRNLRNDVRYRQNRAYLDEYGKQIRDRRMLVAIQKGTGVGKEAVHMSWIEHEYTTLEVLYGAGVKVPKPVARGNNTILMEYIGELDEPAPTLHEVSLSKGEARRLYHELLDNIERMLHCGRVHGDLSAFNVLYWDGDFRIIDLPQAVVPEQNPEAFEIFRRDVIRICQYFTRYGVVSEPELTGSEIARRMWQRHSYRENPLLDQAEEEILLNDEQD